MEATVEDNDSFQRALGEALIAAGKLDKSGLERVSVIGSAGGEARLPTIDRLKG